jgi:hypothetical protein
MAEYEFAIRLAVFSTSVANISRNTFDILRNTSIIRLIELSPLVKPPNIDINGAKNTLINDLM